MATAIIMMKTWRRKKYRACECFVRLADCRSAKRQNWPNSILRNSAGLNAALAGSHSMARAAWGEFSACRILNAP